MQFSRLDLNDLNRYTACWELCPQQAMDYTFVNLWGWQNFYDFHCAFGEKLCWIQKGAKQNTAMPSYRAPIGNWHDIDWAAEPLLQGTEGIQLTRVPEQLVQILEAALPGRIVKEESRGQWEYLYTQEDLAKLSGNRYHKKRNHVNSYKKHYGDVDYRDIDSSVIEAVLSLQDEWCKWHECSNSPSLQAENTAINTVLSHWDDFPMLRGGAIFVEDNLVAFSVGEIVAGNTLGVHFEKGRCGYRGVYQTMNTTFVQRAGAMCQFVNREQDLDEEGLRQAKMSYLPVDFLRKYSLTIMPA